ncbi:deoxyguanosinetriphosphate triphosphohydrolase family protein [Nakamurella endophytica]|uniref:DGTPase n=1 Tax=Nakamurella endophytica TaxID=1748367 RepID=A0A917WDU9_9ACTN|nr:dNTP triphosphohydrolase [Nakamurella endophytica]GGL93853.1 dGTPase [Nakamurella endophytica]
MDPRLARRGTASRTEGGPQGLAAAEFRTDLERIRFSPYFSRLAAVTQVISQGAAGQVVHNRLTHSIKVTAVARAIAVRLASGPDGALLERLGGCDPVVVQAAASAHDLGHPPFGHLGERVLDRIARNRFGLADGFEGNAQSFRILTALDVHDLHGDGLDLTAATRCAVLKYPWARYGVPDPHPSAADPAPRGAGPGPEAHGSGKFSAYSVDVGEMLAARSAYPRIAPWQQTVECSVMDIADDIAYSLHDLDDFHRAGVLQHASVAAEFRTWTRERSALAALPSAELRADDRRPGRSLELLRRRLHAKDGWIVDDDAFATAVGRVATDLVDGLLAVPFDSSRAAERAVGRFTATWIAHFEDSVTVLADPPVRAAHVVLGRQAWHEVAVLKFVHQRFVLDRPDLAMFQRGQAQVLSSLVGDLDSWLSDPMDAPRAPRRLLDLVELAADGYRTLARDRPELLVHPTGETGATADDLARWARGRGILDYVASLTDDRAVDASATLAGHAARLWDAGSAL